MTARKEDGGEGSEPIDDTLDGLGASFVGFVIGALDELGILRGKDR